MTTTRLSEIYGVTQKTICQWKNEGVLAGIETPLNHPDQMPGWWQKMRDAGKFQKGCPVNLLRAAGMTPKPMDDDDREPVDFTPTGKKWDYASSLDLAERNANAVQAIFDKAVSDGNDAGLVALQRTLNDALDSHRALMRDRGKIQLELGETLPKEEVRTALLELHANIQKQLRQGVKSAFAELDTIAASRESWGGFVDGLVDRICLKLTASDFAAD
jgi:hypothetical protein